MKTSSLRIVVLVAIIAPFLLFHPTITRAATVTVMVGQWWILFQTFFRHDSHRRFGALDVEFERTQQYLGFAGDA